MMNYRTIAQPALILYLAIVSGGCLSESDGDATENPNAGSIDLAITSPISTSSMETTDATVSLAGSAHSESGIFEVSWKNDRGGEGKAVGTETWQATALELALGENRITVTAEDIAGLTTSKSVTVNRQSGENGSVSLSWTPPTARVDGSPLVNLAGYKIYYGRMSGIYDYEIDVDNPGVSTYVVEDLVPGEWFFALVAYDTEGLESEHSQEVAGEIG
jgi:Glucodextranase, domain B